MYAINKEDLIKGLMGTQPEVRPRLDIPADWDPDVIREVTTGRDRIAVSTLGHIKTFVLPGLLLIAFIAQLFEVAMLDQFCMGIFSSMLILSGVGAVMDHFFLDRNERAGNYTRLARFLYRSGSSYWKYKDFNENIGVSFPPLLYVAFLAATTIGLGWYLAFAILVLTTAANGYIIQMRDSKARALERYKEAWEAQVEADHQEAITRAEENARKDAEIEKILLEAGGEAPEPPVEANAEDSEGPVHITGGDLPDDLDLATYNQRTIRIEETNPEKFPDDHLDD